MLATRLFHKRDVFTLLLCLVLAAFAGHVATSGTAAELYDYRPGSYGQGRLKYVNGIPVLIVQGTPEQMGRQAGALTGDAAARVFQFPEVLLTEIGLGSQVDKILQEAERLAQNIPIHHKKEIQAFAEQAGLELPQMLAVNAIVDCYRGTIACSSILVEPSASATGEPLFGRNLDFINLGKLGQYSLVTVYKPNGRKKFVSIGFAGMLGCFSGTNESGLALAVHEVLISGDKAPIYDRHGVPYSFVFRRILEECDTIDQAVELLRKTPRTTLLNLALCDAENVAVAEITPRTVKVRRAENGLCFCTNHFRTPELATLRISWRYAVLSKSRELVPLTVEEIHEKLRQVAQGRLTIQTMVFEPRALVLHLAIGGRPSAALPLTRIELRDLFQ